MMGPADFLVVLWGDKPPGLLQIWELDGKRSSYYQAPYGTSTLAGRTDVYTGVALAHKDHGRSRRARADQAIAIAGLWLDLDVNGGPDNKTGAIPTVDDATWIANAITQPTIVVSSGYGLHAWYLFDEPWRFTSRDEQDAAALASAQWYALHRQIVSDRGWGLDHTHDLARLLRLPGTLNNKGGGRQPVTVLEHAGHRYPRQQLLDIAAQAGDVITAPAQMAFADDVDPITAGSTVEPGPKVAALIDNIAEFADTWNHDLGPRATTWSLSEYDLSLCSQAAQAGLTDQDLADLISAHRRRWDPDGAKAARTDYVRRTIAKVRARSDRQTAADTLAALRRAA